MSAMPLTLHGPPGQAIHEELELLQAQLPLAGARILELGCGDARKTLALAATGLPRTILAAEVDAIAHARNLARSDVPGTVRFAEFGAEAIDCPDASIDIVAMFKSLHHVPLAAMDRALAEIARVLAPRGLAWLSEPVFEGSFNDIVRLFHDEQAVREAALEAVGRALEQGLFDSEAQLFFLQPLHMDSFEAFDKGIIQATHSEHRLDPGTLARVRAAFEACRGEAGYDFLVPMRINLLRKRDPARL